MLPALACLATAACESSPPPLPPPRPAARPPAPAELIGQDEGGVRRLLGPPGGERAQGTGRVLSYRAGGCTLDVVLFPDVKSGEARVLAYDMPRESCYAALRGAK
jgi:hypothetical protein